MSDLSGVPAVHCLGHLRRVFPLLERLHDVGCGRDTAGNRELHFDEYVKLVLIYTWNPAIESLRDLQRSMGLSAVARAVGVKRFSLGSFSESVRVFDPELLKEVIAELARGLGPVPGSDPRLAGLGAAITLADGTVLAALPRLARAAAGMDPDGVPAARYTTARDGRGMYGHRLHMELDLRTFAPGRMTLTGARNAGAHREGHVLRAGLVAGKCYVGDGGYADASLFDAVVAAGSNFVVRLREDAVLDVVEERPVPPPPRPVGDDADRLPVPPVHAGTVVRDAVVRLGKPPKAGEPDLRPLRRVVAVHVEPRPRRTRAGGGGTRTSDTILPCTDLPDLPADLASTIYRQRYTVELFFRFLKRLLGLRHLISQRREGIEVQVYCAVIVTLLIHLMTGRQPDRGTAQMVGWYLIGLATEQELTGYLSKPDNKGVKNRAKDQMRKKLGY